MTAPDTNATRHFYDRISSAYDAIADSGEHAARERGLEVLDVQPGEHVLEVGYGTGHSLVSVARATGAEGNVSGVDISGGMRDAALQRLQHAELDHRVDLRVETVPPIPWPDGRFDVVSMSFTLELFPLDVIPRVLAEAKRVLRDSGRLGVVAMSVTPDGERDSFMERTYKWMHRHFPHIVDCQPIPAGQFLRDAGFTLTHEVHVEIWSMPVAVLVGQV